MLKNHMKPLSFILIGCILTGLLVSCGAQPQKPAEDSSTPPTQVYVDNVNMDLPYIIKIDENQIPTDVYKYYFSTAKKSRDNGNNAYWEDNPTALTELKSSTVEQIKKSYAVQELARSCKISLSDAEKVEIDNKISAIQAERDGSGSIQTFVQALYEMKLTLPLYRKLMYEDAVETKLKEHLFTKGQSLYTAKEDVRSKVIAEYFNMSQIFLALDDGDSKKNQDTIKQAKSKLDSGESFDAVFAQFNTDSGLKASTDTYYFDKGQTFENIEKACLSLENDQYSDIIETEKGYHIVMRRAIDETYVDKNIDIFISEIKEKKFESLIKEKANDLSVQYCDIYSQFSATAFE